VKIYKSTHGDDVVIYAKTIEDQAIDQIKKMADSPLGKDAHIRIMPDAHAGAGCVIGTTMHITDKVCPNLVGVDIGCGVSLVQTNIDFDSRLDELDAAIRSSIPFGMDVHSTEKVWERDFEELRCWDKLDKATQERAKCTLGTLGGGNHFIEAYENGYIAVHSGSRNIGLKVAQYYQNLAVNRIKKYNYNLRMEQLQFIEPVMRQQWLSEHHIAIDPDLCYLTGQDMDDYLHDVAILQEFAEQNRWIMLHTIVSAMGGEIDYCIDSVHNYINVKEMILRKGAISAQQGQFLVIPLNMRDGLLICRGKGNTEWNCSAPHGAGRLYSRAQAKKIFTVEEYAETMNGIYSTCINESTLDEAPFVYKDYQEIINCIGPTVDIVDRFKPIYNFKAEA